MPTCSICYEPYKSPISLPCGHIFCRECIFRTVDSTKSCSVQHFCPTCRSPYNVGEPFSVVHPAQNTVLIPLLVTVDSGLVPPYLRPHILPPIRQVFFDTSPKPVSAAPALAGDLGRATAENTALRMSCGMWRRRAELHAAANTGLLGLARAAKDHSQRMRAERDTALNRCALLKRKLCELIPRVPACG
ncbi:hypothetical protein B0H10DRAFT_1129810 [Mycena sp. CBHHK59/15]|nr:hypothetical protein B0H10DRAFT_1129810 [Mycena sp. CBHHK59/15]